MVSRGSDMATSSDGSFQFTGAAPVASSGLDIEKLLAQDPAAINQAIKMGLPFERPASAAGLNPSQPAGTSAIQPQAAITPMLAAPTPTAAPAQTATPTPQATAPAPAQDDKQPYGMTLDGKAPMAGFGANLAAGKAENTYHITTAPNSPMDKIAASLTSGGAQSQTPATNAPNPTTDKTGAPSVPANITPSGTPDDPNQAGLQRAGEMGEKFAGQLLTQPTLEQKLAPIQAQR